MDKKTLITGITGNVGQAVAAHFKKMQVPFLAAVRDINSAAELLGNDLEFIEFDFINPQTYENSLKKADNLFLVRPPAITDVKKYIFPVIDRAKKFKVKHIVFLSLMGIEKNPFPPHYKIEKYIKSSGINYTFLRPGFFMQNLNTTHCYHIQEHNEIFIPAGKALTSFVDTRDIGEAGAMILLGKGHENKAYTLTGNEALDYYQAAKIFSSILGREIKYTNPSPWHFRKVMIERGIKPEFVNVMVTLYLTTRMGMAKKVTPDLERILGRKPTTLEKYVTDYKKYWIH